MTGRNFELRLAVESRPDDVESFYWTLDGQSTFTGGLGPYLGQLGVVPEFNIGLVRLAVAVYAADRSVSRASGGSDWNQREIRLSIPVSDPTKWTSWAVELEGMLGFLSGDSWGLSFYQDPGLDEPRGLTPAPSDRVVLFSGGADSAIGALASRLDLSPAGDHVLVSHYSASYIAPIQRRLAQSAASLVAGPTQTHEVFHLARRSKRLDGTEFEFEPSSRTRSFLFLALGLAVATVRGCNVWIPENGFASLNPPLGPERRGSLSTRTTHPKFIADVNSWLASAGALARVDNPFAGQTKGEMFAMAVAALGEDATSRYLSDTNSCASTGQRAFHYPLTTQCGVCFGCVLRRASFKAAALEDRTTYISRGGSDRLDRWVDRTSVEDAVRDLVSQGIAYRDLLALSLPFDYPLRDALDLASRGLTELAAYVDA